MKHLQRMSSQLIQPRKNNYWPSRFRPTISQSVNRLIWGTPLFDTWGVPIAGWWISHGKSHQRRATGVAPFKAPNRPSDFFDRTKIPPLFRADSARIWLGAPYRSMVMMLKEGLHSILRQLVLLAPSLCPPSIAIGRKPRRSWSWMTRSWCQERLKAIPALLSHIDGYLKPFFEKGLSGNHLSMCIRKSRYPLRICHISILLQWTFQGTDGVFHSILSILSGHDSGFHRICLDVVNGN